MNIKILSNSTINKIAAGEVIERPSSVVKELVENSIDASSTKIEISLEAAGKNLIVVKDNGFGMSQEEMEIAIQRHATSKLDEDDLLNINSFGFRGEALPSIGAISKFKLTSKKKGSDIANSLTITGGNIENTVRSNRENGTTIEIRDLFFATPARLKFLRTDRTELLASVQIVKKMCLAHPRISFILKHDGKELIKVRGKDGCIKENIKDRIIDVVGNEFIENSSEISYISDNIEIFGYTSLPTYNRAAAEDQFLFINNRPVKDKILNIALKVAYQDYLSRGRHPVTVMFLKLSPYFVDMNVHPAKTEVRFHDPNLVRKLVIDAIKHALNNSSDRVSTKTSEVALNYMNPINPASNLKEHDKTNFKTFNFQKHKQIQPTQRTDYSLAQSNMLPEEKPQSVVEEDYPQTVDNEEISTNKYRLGAAKAQMHETYIISQTDDSIIITDQHAAHERIGYEKIKKQIEKNGLIKQRLLIPEIIEFTDEKRADLIYQNKNSLEKLGLTIENFGEKSIIVSEIPSLIGDVNLKQLVFDISDHLLDMGENIALTELIEHITETYACHYAIRSGKKLNGFEMNELLRQMENTPFSGQCNHGRQTYVELKLSDIEKLFGRR